MTNIATLQPNDKGERRGGRQAGQTNMYTRVMKTALMLAAEASEHGNGSLVRYLTNIANTRPELFCPMLSRLLPVQMKAEINSGPPLRPLDPSMKLDDMITAFAQKIQDPNYYAVPRTIEHENVEDE